MRFVVGERRVIVGRETQKETFAIRITDKGLIFLICKELLGLKKKKINNPVEKWARNINANRLKNMNDIYSNS